MTGSNAFRQKILDHRNEILIASCHGSDCFAAEEVPGRFFWPDFPDKGDSLNAPICPGPSSFKGAIALTAGTLDSLTFPFATTGRGHATHEAGIIAFAIFLPVLRDEAVALSRQLYQALGPVHLLREIAQLVPGG